jgi:GTP cyclohydrolase IA
MNKSKIEDAFRTILVEIGEDINREGIAFTPVRMARLYDNLFYGYRKKLVVMNEEQRNTKCDEDCIPITIFANESKEMLIRKVNCISHCQHHLAIFPMKVWVGIIPNKKLMGMNKIDKVVKYYAARLQIQEQMTTQITDWINDNIEPLGVIVVIRGIHYCAELQGDDGNFTTSAARGYFLEHPENKDPKSEFLRLIDINGKE